jgi:protein-S-isoprenylcysteine O-methyltransferase Ste14
MSFVATVLAETVNNHGVTVPPWTLGIVALCAFAALGFVTWSFRDVANRHSHKAEPRAAEHAGAPGAYHHGGGHPAHDD